MKILKGGRLAPRDVRRALGGRWRVVRVDRFLDDGAEAAALERAAALFEALAIQGLEALPLAWRLSSPMPAGDSSARGETFGILLAPRPAHELAPWLELVGAYGWGCGVLLDPDRPIDLGGALGLGAVPVAHLSRAPLGVRAGELRASLAAARALASASPALYVPAGRIPWIDRAALIEIRDAGFGWVVSPGFARPGGPIPLARSLDLAASTNARALAWLAGSRGLRGARGKLG